MVLPVSLAVAESVRKLSWFKVCGLEEAAGAVFINPARYTNM